MIFTEEYGLIPVSLDIVSAVPREVFNRRLVQIQRLKEKDALSLGAKSREGHGLYAGGVVGLFSLGKDVSVLVRPRFPANLSEMARVVGKTLPPIDFTRSYQGLEPQSASEEVLDFLATNYIEAAEEVLHQGLSRTYTEISSITSSPKGRIDVAETIRKLAARGIDYKVSASFFARKSDTPENQALVEALHWCRKWANYRSSLESLRPRIHNLLHSLRHIHRDETRSFLSATAVRRPKLLPQSRSSYWRALPLAVALLERRGFSLDSISGTVSLSSLLIRTSDLFEDYVRKMLSHFLAGEGIDVVDGNKMNPIPLYTQPARSEVPDISIILDPGPATVKPDILLQDNGKTKLIADVKYKRIEQQADRNSVTEQLVTYAHRLDCTQVVSIHPTSSGQKEGLYVSGNLGVTTVYSYRVNIGGENLEDSMRSLSSALLQISALQH